MRAFANPPCGVNPHKGWRSCVGEFRTAGGSAMISKEKELKERIRAILRVSKALRKRGVPHNIVGADLSQYEPGQCVDGGKYAYYKVIIVKPRGAYYIYTSSADFVYCPRTGNFCSCPSESEECYKMAKRENKIKLTIESLASALETYSDKLAIKVKTWGLTQGERKFIEEELGFIYGEREF